MILFYSGGSTFDTTPEHIFKDQEGHLPGVMLTYWELEGDFTQSTTIQRFERHCKRRGVKVDQRVRKSSKAKKENKDAESK